MLSLRKKLTHSNVTTSICNEIGNYNFNMKKQTFKSYPHVVMEKGDFPQYQITLLSAQVEHSIFLHTYVGSSIFIGPIEVIT